MQIEAQQKAGRAVVSQGWDASQRHEFLARMERKLRVKESMVRGRRHAPASWFPNKPRTFVVG